MRLRGALGAGDRRLQGDQNSSNKEVSTGGARLVVRIREATVSVSIWFQSFLLIGCLGHNMHRSFDRLQPVGS